MSQDIIFVSCNNPGIAAANFLNIVPTSFLWNSYKAGLDRCLRITGVYLKTKWK